MSSPRRFGADAVAFLDELCRYQSAPCPGTRYRTLNRIVLAAAGKSMSDKRLFDASRVLVVEDDDLVRLCAAEMLRDAGFSVIEAANADEAWAIMEGQDDVDVLFTDIDMPGSMCGLSLANKVCRCWPTIRLVVTSGRRRFSDGDMPDHGLFLPKPYNGQQVVEAICRAG